jgi:hypothetical protein
MGYVLAAIIVLALVAGFITFFVINATKRKSENPADIAAPDETPLGDTSQHSGVDPQEGSDPDPGPDREREREDTRTESEKLANKPR